MHFALLAPFWSSVLSQLGNGRPSSQQQRNCRCAAGRQRLLRVFEQHRKACSKSISSTVRRRMCHCCTRVEIHFTRRSLIRNWPRYASDGTQRFFACDQQVPMFRPSRCSEKDWLRRGPPLRGKGKAPDACDSELSPTLIRQSSCFKFPLGCRRTSCYRSFFRSSQDSIGDSRDGVTVIIHYSWTPMKAPGPGRLR